MAAFLFLPSSFLVSLVSNNKRSSRIDLTATNELLCGMAVPVHLPSIANAACTGMAAVITPVFARQMNASDATLGAILALRGFGAMLSDVPSGLLVQRYGIRATMVCALVLSTVSVVVYAASLNALMLACVCTVLGCAASAFGVARHRFLRDAVDSTKRGRLMSLVGGGGRWANVVGPTLAGFLIAAAGCRLAALSQLLFLGVSIACIACSTRIAVVDKKLRGEAAGSPVDHAGSNGCGCEVAFRALRNHFRAIFNVGVFSCSVLTLRTCRKMLLPLAALNMKLGATHAGMFLSVSFVFDAVLFFAGGFIMDRWGRRFAAVPTSVALGLAFFVLSFATSTPLLYFSAVCFGVSNSLGSGLMLTIVADAVQGPDAPVVMSLLRLAQDAGQMAGPVFVGILLSATSFSVTCYALTVLGVSGRLLGRSFSCGTSKRRGCWRSGS